ncbi:hypothetical protein [Salirhabdus salicampi]|uniref:hypothetical protein n=1 Tax=Salirhabdus salicampi TaxID=476102 RepID=UPI0020C2BC06|nr:hypothetical protein [Salirhabdus salicampi]MCP8616148.1 hypothetical protein [Salirhabdus salicampi]
MQRFEGQLIHGECDLNSNEFLLTQVKNIDTQSIINDRQMKTLYHYLMKTNEEQESCVITVNDQIPLMLNKEDVPLMLHDLQQIMNDLNQSLS